MDNIRRFLTRILQPFSVFIGRLYYAPKKRAIKAKDVFEMASVLKSGDVIVSFSAGEFTNYFIDGKFKHAAMYIGESQVVEAISKGVTINTVDEFCSGKDKIAILRALFCSEAEASSAAIFAKSHAGKPYDYNFEPNERAFYCSELVWFSYAKVLNEKSPFTRRTVMGVETVLPVDFYNADDKFELVLELPQI